MTTPSTGLSGSLVLDAEAAAAEGSGEHLEIGIVEIGRDAPSA